MDFICQLVLIPNFKKEYIFIILKALTTGIILNKNNSFLKYG